MPNLSLLHYPCANDAHPDEVFYQGEITECADCRTEYSEFEAQSFIELNGEQVCTTCAELCSGFCGEWLSDDSIREYGPIVNFRDPTGNGKLVSAHASCAADYLLMCFGLDTTIEEPSREAIAAVLTLPASLVVA